MKLTVREDSANYACTVIKLPAKQKVEGLDNLVKVTVFGNDCLIGKNSPEDELYLFFPSECAIAGHLLHDNNLYRDSSLNNTSTIKGFFEPNGRVKALKFKGIISTGFVIPLYHCLASLSAMFDLSKLKEGDEFTDIDNINICKKYKIVHQHATISKESKHNKKLARFDKLVPNQFRFHVDTSHLAKNLHVFKPEDLIVITDKWHGCVSHDTVVETLEFGELQIKKIVDDKIKCRIKAFDILSQEVVYAPIDDFFFKKNDGDWLEIELENGKKIKITDNNPVWLPDFNCYREAKFLKDGDVLLID